LFTSSLSWTTM